MNELPEATNVITYKNNKRVVETTTNVQKLREYLAQFPEDVPVLFTWEGIYTTVHGFEIDENSFDEPVLVLNVDNY